MILWYIMYLNDTHIKNISFIGIPITPITLQILKCAMHADSWFQNGSSSMTRAWWRHQMEIFSALLGICAGNSPVPGEFPAQRPVTLSFDAFFHLRLNKRLSKQSGGWWFETPSRPLWRHSNGRKFTSILLLMPSHCMYIYSQGMFIGVHICFFMYI